MISDNNVYFKVKVFVVNIIINKLVMQYCKPHAVLTVKNDYLIHVESGALNPHSGVKVINRPFS